MVFLPEHLTKLQYPGIFFDTVLSVDRWVNLALKEGECGQFPYIPGVCNLTKSLISVSSTFYKKKEEKCLSNNFFFHMIDIDL